MFYFVVAYVWLLCSNIIVVYYGNKFSVWMGFFKLFLAQFFISIFTAT